MNNGRDCAHGRQIGKCDTCDLIEAEKEIEALKAQLKKSTHTNYSLMTMINRYAAEITRCQRKEGWNDNHPLVEVNTMTPAQCLAEIKAQAVEEILSHFDNKFRANEKLTVKNVCWMLNEHLKQLRQQAAKGE